MKKAMVIFLGLLLVVSLAGCTGGNATIIKSDYQLMPAHGNSFFGKGDGYNGYHVSYINPKTTKLVSKFAYNKHVYYDADKKEDAWIVDYPNYVELHLPKELALNKDEGIKNIDGKTSYVI